MRFFFLTFCLLLTNSLLLVAQPVPFCGNNAGNGVITDCISWQDMPLLTGFFTQLCGDPMPHIAHLDGDEWITLGNGLPTEGHALAVINDQLYAAVYQLAVDSNWVFRWDDGSWQKVGAGVYLTTAVAGFSQTPSIYDVIEYDGQLIACGEFDRVGEQSVSGIMKWNGSNWEPLGSGLAGNISGTAPVLYPHQLLVWDDLLLVVGNFNIAGGQVANGVAAWDGNTWSAFGNGFNSTAYAAAIFEGDFWVGGDFTMADGVAVKGLARWNGSSWENPGLGISDSQPNGYAFVHTLKVIDDFLYIAGGFNQYELNGTDTYSCGNILSLKQGIVGTLDGGAPANIEGVMPFGNGLLLGGGLFGSTYLASWAAETNALDIESENDEILIFPNPVAEKLTIRWPGKGEEAIYQVFDMSGRFLHSGRTNEAVFELPFEQLPEGAYWILIQNAEKTWQQMVFRQE